MTKIKTTEGEFRSQIVTWLNMFIKERSCPFEVATSDPSLKVSEKETRFPDVQLWLNRKAEQGFCGFELKTPTTPVDDEKLLREAVEKAHAMNATYFVTWNMRDTIIWETPSLGKSINRENRKKTYPSISQINIANDLWNRFKSGLLQARTIELIDDLSRLYHEGHLYEIDVDATFFVRKIRGQVVTLHTLMNFSKVANKLATVLSFLFLIFILLKAWLMPVYFIFP